ncbi:hypothetical protein ACFLVN_02305 [Chloroflexota bacterium]
MQSRIVNRPLDRWFRGSKWGVTTFKELPHSISGQDDAVPYKIEHWLDELEPGNNTPYDPITETPEAYLKFARLGEADRFAWDANRQVREVLRFCKEHGPPWYPKQILRGNWSTYDNYFMYNQNIMYPEEMSNKAMARGWPPLTVERVLVAARIMGSVVRLYKLLREIENDNRPVNDLKNHIARHMTVILDRDFFSLRLATTTGDLRIPESTNDPDRKFVLPPLNNDDEVIATAIAYLEYGITKALVDYPVRPALANRRKALTYDESVVGAWVAAFAFDNLLAVFWWQFYNAILNRTQLKECRNEKCLRLFKPVRSDQEYCNPLCRDAARKRRQYQIRKMRDNNQTKEVNNERPHSKEG